MLSWGNHHSRVMKETRIFTLGNIHYSKSSSVNHIHRRGPFSNEIVYADVPLKMCFPRACTSQVPALENHCRCWVEGKVSNLLEGETKKVKSGERAATFSRPRGASVEKRKHCLLRIIIEVLVLALSLPALCPWPSLWLSFCLISLVYKMRTFNRLVFGSGSQIWLHIRRHRELLGRLPGTSHPNFLIHLSLGVGFGNL